MFKWKPPELYERNNDAAIKDLAIGLRQGQISLLLGAGCSFRMALPSWPQLVRRCCEEIAGLRAGKVAFDDIKDDWPGEKMLMRMALARRSLNDEARYRDIIKGNLYSDWKGRAPDEPTTLLRAIGTLAIGSERGRVRDILTLNFDSVLEWHFAMHGYVIQVVESVPTVLRQADVTMYHPHGYVPFSDKFGEISEEILFDQESVERRIIENPAWNETFRHFLGSHIFIAIGLSGNDALLRLLLKAADDQRRDERPLGFWFYRDLDTDIMEDLRSKSVAMLKVANFEEIEQALFAICREAAGPILI
jgi:hypothetical protein